MNQNDKRNAMAPVPDNLANFLSALQMLCVKRLESFGWELQFVRRKGVPAPIPVVFEPGSKKTGVIDEDGALNTQHGLRIRH